MMAFTNIFTNISINAFFRKRFLLQNSNSNLALISSHAMTSILPPAAAASLASTYFFHNLFRMSPYDCITCREIKTIMIHLLGKMYNLFLFI